MSASLTGSPFARLMTMARLSLICALALIGLSAGCTYHVWSPPARAIPISGVGRLAGGEVRAQVTTSFHGDIDVFNDRLSVAEGALGVAVGLGDGLDLRLGGQTLYVAGGMSQVDRGVFAGRAGLRWAPEDWVAVSGGLGAGASAAGAFVNPDLGLTLGDGDPDVGFFVDLRAGVSLPVDPITLNLRLPSEEVDRLATPTPTAVIQITPGLRFTLLHSRPSEVGLVLRVTPNLTILADEKLSSLWVGAALSLEVIWPSE